MSAPEKFAAWMAAHEHKDKNFGWVYHYHPRSDAHSVALCELIAIDIVGACPILLEQAKSDSVVYGINVLHGFPNGKEKTLDLAIGTPATINRNRPRLGGLIYPGTMKRALICCEAKATMTEHSKSQPRVFDELGSSHEIVHQGDREAIAAGVLVVNIAKTFVSPLRQRNAELEITTHKQPKAAERMIAHVRGLPVRDTADGIGFDALATIVVDCDNQGPAFLWTEAPAPQEGDRDHYATFIARLVSAYESRFSTA